MSHVEKIIKEKKSELGQRVIGKRDRLPNKTFVIYACHQYSKTTHNETAKYFGLTHRGIISPSLKRKKINDNQWQREIKLLIIVK